jgi:hypothetical protein
MEKTNFYKRFPLWIPLLAVLVSFIGYIIGALILSGFGIIYSVLYLIYCFGAELVVIIRSCKDCWYYGKLCGIGKGIVAPLFVKKGDTKKFAERDISLVHLIPDFLVVIFPLVGGIILLIIDFSFLLLSLVILLIILFFGGTAILRGMLVCKHCKQKEIGCPAEKMFIKKNSKK